MALLKDFIEVFRCRALIQALVVRELKARYRGSILGFLWSLLNPFLLMLVYWLVFSVYLRYDNLENYHVFLFCGLLPWIWFSSSLLEGCNSIIAGASLVKKVLFPAEILPIVVVLSNLIHFFLALPILIVFLIVTGINSGFNILGFPIIVFVQLLFTLGLVLLISAVSVHLRDIQQILANVVTLWFFLTPIIYPASSLPPKAKDYMFFMVLNPMWHIMEGYHHVFLKSMVFKDGNPLLASGFPWYGLLGVTVFSIFLIVISYHVFSRFKSSFSEEI
ncbi:ABC transporter permease [bacterium]|nr:ABC transporter permease [candidate division CSSED10-310 bacterium]